MQKLTIILYYIFDQGLFTTLTAHMVPSIGVIWKQPIFKMAIRLPSCTKADMWTCNLTEWRRSKTCWNLWQPNLTPCDYHLFCTLGDRLRGYHFLSSEVKMSAHDWIHQQPQNIFSRGIHVLLWCWRKCARCHGHCIQDRQAQLPFGSWNLIFVILIWMTFTLYPYVNFWYHIIS